MSHVGGWTQVYREDDSDEKFSPSDAMMKDGFMRPPLMTQVLLGDDYIIIAIEKAKRDKQEREAREIARQQAVIDLSKDVIDHILDAATADIEYQRSKR